MCRSILEENKIEYHQTYTEDIVQEHGARDILEYIGLEHPLGCTLSKDQKTKVSYSNIISNLSEIEKEFEEYTDYRTF